MLVLLTYDVDIKDPAGEKRLRKIAKKCVSYGIRVQNSVFECNVNASELKMLKYDILKIYDKTKDSIRIYNLGNNYKTKVEHFGAKETKDLEEPLIF